MLSWWSSNRSLPGVMDSCLSLCLGTSSTKNCFRSRQFGKYKWIWKEYLVTHHSQKSKEEWANRFSPVLFAIFQLIGETENSHQEKLSDDRKYDHIQVCFTEVSVLLDELYILQSTKEPRMDAACDGRCFREKQPLRDYGRWFNKWAVAGCTKRKNLGICKQNTREVGRDIVAYSKKTSDSLTFSESPLFKVNF